MPCSRTPKWKFRPANDPGATAVEGLIEAEEMGSLVLRGLLKPVPTFNVRRLTEQGG